MNRLIFIVVFAAMSLTLAAQENKLHYVDASELTIVGKLMDDTTNPYHRVDTVKYKGFTKTENIQVRCSAGEAIMFNTDSPEIWLDVDYAYAPIFNGTMNIATRGFDLYIKNNGKWIWAGIACPKIAAEDGVISLMKDMDSSLKECMLYLPLYSELNSLKIGVKEGSIIEAGEAPFRHRIGIFGSSLTHGIGCTRPGMTYPAQFSRLTGLQLLSLGCSGNCRLQSYFADVLADADVDALVFDAFSNPSVKMIEERLFPFIEKIQTTHPDIPLIFQHTIYRENRNYNLKIDANERLKRETADRLMKEACKKYKNVYLITVESGRGDHETSVDGTHPSDEGYRIWALSIEKKIIKILKKYGIK